MKKSTLITAIIMVVLFIISILGTRTWNWGNWACGVSWFITILSIGAWWVTLPFNPFKKKA
jgi:hypothetical protein